MKLRQRFGPGLLVTAAFIGPGTVTTATKAGAGFGYALLWVLLLSVVATIVFQEMAARLGLVTRQGLGEALRATFPNAVARTLGILLVISAIAFGNAAYQAGNITGAAIALEAVSGLSHQYWAVGVGVLASILLWTGSYRVFERTLIGLVVLMSVVFIVTALIARPNWSALAHGFLSPSIPGGSLTLTIALIGTTVVPYNLFLHASAVSEKWPASSNMSAALRAARVDTIVAVLLGGLITMAIVTTAATFYAQGAQISNASEMARQLEPVLGRFAGVFFSLGLLAAGMTSAITAPLAAAYATGGALGWARDMRSTRYRLVWIVIVLAGTWFAAMGKQPVQAIIFAQAANGLILPVIAMFLLWIVNREKLMGEHANRLASNLLGFVVVMVVAALGVYKLYQVVKPMFATSGG